MKWALIVRATASLLLASNASGSACSYEKLCHEFARGYQNSAGERVRAKFSTKLNRKVFQNPKNKARIEITFRDAKNLIHQVIDQEAMIPQSVRSNLHARVNALQLSLQPDRATSSGYNAVFWADSFEILAEYSVVELPRANLINLFAHEVAHSFDDTAAQYSIVKDGKIFYQNDESQNPSAGKREIIADPFDFNELAPLVTIVTSLGVKETQISEAMSDYFARLVSERYLVSIPSERQKSAAVEGQMDLIVQGCTQWKYVVNDAASYPSLRTRVEKLYFGSHFISKLAGCDL